ncbi:MAG: dephospho-CoA kinase [Phycisphaerae bacterium]|nr:dephospho-CoA kinase [Phycisphaerae bacterium]
MKKKDKKAVIGIIGGIGSGKSTVASEFGKLGCPVIDADKIAHDLLRTPDIRQKTIELFGSEVICESTGEVDRKKLGKIVFSDPQKLSSLTEILHPGVLERSEALIEQYNRDRQVKVIVLDMPLLVEVGWVKRCDRIVFVRSERTKRLERTSKKANFNENQFKNREKLQISLDNKLSIADNVIDNNSDFSALAQQVQSIFSELMNK